MTDSTSPTAERVRRTPPFGAPYVFVLAIVDGDGRALVHRVEKSETVIGRDPGADFLLDDDTVSKRHALVRVDGGVFTLVDLDSLNGTRVNGRRLAPGTAQRLRHLDEFEIGAVRLLLLAGKFRLRGAE